MEKKNRILNKVIKYLDEILDEHSRGLLALTNVYRKSNKLNPDIKLNGENGKSLCEKWIETLKQTDNIVKLIKLLPNTEKVIVMERIRAILQYHELTRNGNRVMSIEICKITSPGTSETYSLDLKSNGYSEYIMEDRESVISELRKLLQEYDTNESSIACRKPKINIGNAEKLYKELIEFGALENNDKKKCMFINLCQYDTPAPKANRLKWVLMNQRNKQIAQKSLYEFCELIGLISQEMQARDIDYHIRTYFCNELSQGNKYKTSKRSGYYDTLKAMVEKYV